MGIEVVLEGVADDERSDPGRVFAVGPAHSFEQLADAINASFGRWDLSHLHEFELASGRKIGFPDDEFSPEVVWEDQAQIKVSSAIGPGEEFSFTFDFGAAPLPGDGAEDRAARGLRRWAAAQDAHADVRVGVAA